MAKTQKDSVITFYIVLGYKDHKGKRANYALLRKEDADLWNEEGDGKGVIEVRSEEFGWMKQAADAACQFQQWAECGHLEMSTLAHGIENYEQEIYHRRKK